MRIHSVGPVGRANLKPCYCSFPHHPGITWNPNHDECIVFLSSQNVYFEGVGMKTESVAEGTALDLDQIERLTLPYKIYQ